MAYRYQSRRYAKKLARQSRTNFIITLIIIGFLVYATIQWVLPTLINSLGFITGTFKPSHKNTTSIPENASFAPPVLNIPYEATNSAEIDIRGYGTPNSKVAIFLDDEKKDTVDVSDDGTFEINNIQLVLGTNNIYGKSIDQDGKESLSSKLIKVIYDNEKPFLEILEPEDGKSIQGERKIKVSGKTDSESKVFINDSRVIVNSDGTFTSIHELNDGENIFTIRAQDLASNETEVLRKVNFSP